MKMGGGLLRAFFVVIAVMVLVELLFVGGGKILSSEAAPSITTHSEMITSESRASVRPDLDPNYMSKRRVPNGPDPIHNRGAGKSRQPPGRA